MIDKVQRDWVVLLSTLEDDSNLMDLVRYCPLDILRFWQFNRFSSQTTLFEQGKVYDAFYLIIEGSVEVYVQSPDGKKYSQAQYRRGDMIGELEIFERKPYICTVRALDDVSLLSVPREHFIRWLQLDNHFNNKILHRFSELYYLQSQKAAKDSLYSLLQRVCLFLLDNIPQQNKAEPAQAVEIKVNKQQLSHQLAVTLRSINRIFAQLRQSGIISVDEERVNILNIDYLKQQVNR